MKKNFVVATPTQQEYDALMQWAEANGYKWLENTKATQNSAGFTYGKDTLICLRSAGNMTYGTDYGYKQEHGPIVPFSTFAAIQGIELGPESVNVQLTDSYMGTVDYQKQIVSFGCQFMPFSKVAEVYELTRKHEPQPVQKPTMLDADADDIINKAMKLAGSFGSIHNHLRIGGYRLIKEPQHS